MKRLKLNFSNVIFHPEDHTYESDGRILTSVTQIIKKHVMPGLYDGVDRALLAEKAAYGTMVHRAIEDYETGFSEENVSNPDVQAYIAWSRKSGFRVTSTEYLVSDGTTNAGMIDQVRYDGKDVVLADVKTTSTLNMEYLSNQLSLYAHDFEFMNPEVKVTKLLAIHLKDGECKAVEVPRLPDEYINALLLAEANDVEFHDPLKNSCDDAETIVARLRQLELEMLDYKAYLKPREDEVKKLKERLYELAKSKSQTGFDCEGGVVKVGADSVSDKFSLETLSQNAPVFFKRYTNIFKKGYAPSVTKGRVTIKFK